jgi:hypothetical protein
MRLLVIAGCWPYPTIAEEGELRRTISRMTARECDGDFFESIDKATGSFHGGRKLARTVPCGTFGPGGQSCSRPAWEIGARSLEISSDRSGNFVYGIINQIRAQSEELCARYGSPGDCLEEAEVCLTMRDTEDNEVRLCLNTIPEEAGGDGGRCRNHA